MNPSSTSWLVLRSRWFVGSGVPARQDSILLALNATIEVAEHQQPSLQQPPRSRWERFAPRRRYRAARIGGLRVDQLGRDATTDFSRASGIGSVIPDLLNRGPGGSYGYRTDIAGYIDAFGGPDEELFVRWAQLATLLHGMGAAAARRFEELGLTDDEDGS